MKFKVGDRVEHKDYGKGMVIGISVTDMPLVEFDNHFSEFHGGGRFEVNDTKGKDGHCWYTDEIEPLGTQAIVIYPKGLETIALLKEGKKVIKQASAKCNPSDTYDFNIGAKLAFQRLMGEEATTRVKPYREVKRPAKVGEWIRITSDKIYGGIASGDIKQVKAVYGSTIGVDGKFKALGDGYWCYREWQYVVLENYQPKTKKMSDYTDKELVDELSRRLEDKQ